jgi:Leucine-rich repeat (LRR) protein
VKGCDLASLLQEQSVLEIKESDWDSITSYLSSFFPNAAETAIALDLLKQGVNNLIPMLRDKGSFCDSPLMFTDNYNVFSCTESGASTELTSFSHIPAKASWTFISILVWALLARFKPQYKTRKGTYSWGDMVQLMFCSSFLTTLAGVLVHKLSILGEAAGHGVGIVLLVVSYMYCFVVCALLKGKASREINTKETNPVMKWYNMFKVLTDVNDGPYYFAYSFVLEVLEIIVQFSSFDAMVRTNDLSYVRWSATIISLNLILTPMSYFASRLGRECGRKLTYITDTLLESAYLFLNLNVVREQDLAQVVVVLSIMFPLLALLAKVDTFVEATTTIVDNTERRDSWVQKLIKVNLTTAKHKWTAKQKKAIELAVVLTSGFGLFVLVYMMSSAYHIDARCGDTIGVKIWENARPRYVFADGPLSPKCNFPSIKEVRAHRKGIKVVRKEIGFLTSVVHLDLSGNSIERLPVEITKLEALTHVNMADNPVWKYLDWHGQQLVTFPEILRFFTKLERLDLGHNRIETIPESIGRLQGLSELTLQNNSIVALSQEVTRLMLLKKFDVEHNPVAMSLSWHGVDPAGAVRIFRFMGGLIELDISDGRFENVNEVMLALPRLQKLNVSNNLIRAVAGTDGNHVRELDVSNNPGMTLIDWSHASLDSIKVNGLSALSHLRLRGNQLQSIDVNHLTALTYLNLDGNQIQYIDLNRSTALVHLSLYNNKLQLIGVNHLTALTFLSLENNTLQSIDLTGLLALAYLDLRGNQLKSIKNITGLNRAITNLHI